MATMRLQVMCIMVSKDTKRVAKRTSNMMQAQHFTSLAVVNTSMPLVKRRILPDREVQPNHQQNDAE